MVAHKMIKRIVKNFRQKNFQKYGQANCQKPPSIVKKIVNVLGNFVESFMTFKILYFLNQIFVFRNITKVQNIQIVSSFCILNLENKGGREELFKGGYYLIRYNNENLKKQSHDSLIIGQIIRRFIYRHTNTYVCIIGLILCIQDRCVPFETLYLLRPPKMDIIFLSKYSKEDRRGEKGGTVYELGQ